jgi:hypothetical protein|tara:strand:- start:1063 stop:1269 length:207 start_codon:yes stop_codon:yes gene_type:complete
MPAPKKRNWVFLDSNTGKKTTKQFETEDQAVAHATANSNLSLVRTGPAMKNYATLTQVGNVTKINKAS